MVLALFYRSASQALTKMAQRLLSNFGEMEDLVPWKQPKKGESHELRRPPQTTGLVFKVFGIYQPENRKNWQRWQEVWLVSSYSLCIFLLGMMALIDQQG